MLLQIGGEQLEAGGEVGFEVLHDGADAARVPDQTKALSDPVARQRLRTGRPLGAEA